VLNFIPDWIVNFFLLFGWVFAFVGAMFFFWGVGTSLAALKAKIAGEDVREAIAPWMAEL